MIAPYRALVVLAAPVRKGLLLPGQQGVGGRRVARSPARLCLYAPGPTVGRPRI